ncbi:hypothetical protein [Clostridium cadaveris]|uniref:hypothetical protein n=1 Tax=Clostridium cadaveris TaxID=1529 RepID=UPI000C06D214|nr:hypothetical protein [Clostridium cadaveris]
MANIMLQDLSAVIHGTSRYGIEYDVAHVTMLIKVDEPIAADAQWAIPHIEDIPQKALNLIKDGKTAIYPMLKSKLRNDISNILENIDNKNMDGLLDDIEKALLLTSMHETNLQAIDTANCLYVVSYKYRLYPVEPNNFDFKVLLPFDGLVMSSSGRLQVTLIAPTNASINPVVTKGEDPSTGQQFEEQVISLSNVNKNVVTFVVQNDPLFTIRYNY